MQDDSKHIESSNLTNMWEPTVKSTMKSNSTVICGSDQANFKAFLHCVRVVESSNVWCYWTLHIGYDSVNWWQGVE